MFWALFVLMLPCACWSHRVESMSLQRLQAEPASMKASWLSLLSKAICGQDFGFAGSVGKHFVQKGIAGAGKVLWPNVRGRLGRIQSQICRGKFGRGLHQFRIFQLELATGQQSDVVSEVALVKFGNATASLLAEACRGAYPKLLRVWYSLVWEARAQQASSVKTSRSHQTQANRKAAEAQLSPDLGNLLSDVACSGAIGCFLLLIMLVHLVLLRHQCQSGAS